MPTSFGKSYLHRLQQGLLTASWVAVVATTALSCARSVDPVSGSETHFLEACNMTCSSGLECVDGQCSQHCSNDDVCTNLNRNATCETQPSGVQACEVGCSEDADCTELQPELSCRDGVCRGPLWQPNSDANPDASSDDNASDGDATNDQVSDTSDTNASDGSDSNECGEPDCPPEDAMWFTLPEEGMGTVRLEFMFNLEEQGLTRCSVEFVDDEIIDSNCESDSVPAAVLDEGCPPMNFCPAGSLRFDLHPIDFDVNFWRNGYEVFPVDTTDWEQLTFAVGPEGCEFSCTMKHLTRRLPTTKNSGCLNTQSACDFGLGCGDRASALANAPVCDAENEAVLAGEGCGYDVLIYQRYIESERAFYDKETGRFVGYWHQSDTFEVDCSGLVPFDCTEFVEAVDVCEAKDAGTPDSGMPDGGAPDANLE